MSATVGLVIPAYQPHPGDLCENLRTLAETVAPEIVRIEFDSPTESTVRAISELSTPDCRIEVNSVDRRRGKGAAITAGFEALSTDVLAFADADGSTPADSFVDVVDPVREGSAALAVGSRRHPDAEIEGSQTLVRRRLGDGFGWLARQLLPVALTDYQCGAKAIHRDTWADVREHCYAPGFGWDIDLLAAAGALGYEVREVPIRWEDRPGSTVSPVADTLRMGRSLLRASHRAKVIEGDRVHAQVSAWSSREPALISTVGGGDAETESPLEEAAD